MKLCKITLAFVTLSFVNLFCGRQENLEQNNNPSHVNAEGREKAESTTRRETQLKSFREKISQNPHQKFSSLQAAVDSTSSFSDERRNTKPPQKGFLIQKLAQKSANEVSFWEMKKSIVDLFFEAVRYKTMDEMLALFEEDVSVHYRNLNHDSPLHSAVEMGQIEKVRFLLAHGADVNTQNQSGTTPLHLAAEHITAHTREIMEELMKYGADPRIENNFRLSAYDIAKQKKYQFILDLLDKYVGLNNAH